MTDTASSSTAPRLSVVICSHNRAASLERCLASLRAAPSRAPIEIIVVDSGSTDATASVIDRCAALDSRVRSLHEHIPGLSRARNSGVAEAVTPYVLFLDDDVTVRDGCVDAHLEILEDNPRCDAVAGAVELTYDVPLPRWWDPAFESFLGVLAVPEDQTFVAREAVGVGANLSFRRAALSAAGGFDERLGRVGRSLISGEETVALIAVQRAGGEVVVTGKALVDHHVGSERLTMTWFLARSFAHGRTRVRRGMRVELWRALAHVVLGDRSISRPGRPWRPWVALAMVRRADWLGRAYETVRSSPASTPVRSAVESASTGTGVAH